MVAPLKYLSYFWRILDMLLINYEVNVILTWSKNYVLTDIITKYAEGDNPAIAALKKCNITIKDTALYVPVITL